MQKLKNILKEPLILFLILGAFLYVIYIKTVPIFAPNELTISKDELVNFMQYQANGFNRQVFEKKYQALSKTDKDKLLAQYLEEEVLVKEAQKLNLQENDNVIRKRLVQKIKFILQNEIEEDGNVDDSALKKYFEEHKNQYAVNEKYSFTHVFFAFENHSEAEALKLTQDFLAQNKTKFISGENALDFSERYPYHHNYILRDLDFIQTNFDADFTEKLKQLQVNKHLWQGPVKSNLGYHAILLIGKEASSISDFEQIKDIVKGDYLRERESGNLKLKIDNLKKQYKIKFIEK